MNILYFIRKQVAILIVFSFLISFASIVHGIFIDFDVSQIKRFTIEGLLFTFFVVFPAILFLEWVFDINNRERFEKIERRLDRIKSTIR